MLNFRNLRISDHRFRFSLVVLSALITRLIYVTFTVDPEYDGYDRFVRGIFLISDLYNITHHWCWLPLFQYINAALYYLTRSYTAVRILSTIYGVLSIIMVYFITLKITGSRDSSLLASVLLAFNPLIFFYDTTGMTEPLFTLLILISIYIFIGNRPYLFSLPIAVACLVRYEAWFLTPLLLLISVLQKRLRWTTALLTALPPLASVSAWLYMNYICYGNPFMFVNLLSLYMASPKRGLFEVLRYLSIDESSFIGLKAFLIPIWYPLGCLFLLTPPVFFESIRGMIRYAGRDGNKITLTILPIFYISLLTYFMFIGKSEGWLRYSMPIIPFFIIFSAHHVAEGYSFGGKRIFIASSFIISLLLLCMITTLSSSYISSTLQVSEWLNKHATDGRILCLRTPIIVISDLPLERFVFLWDQNLSRHAFINFLRKENVSYIISYMGSFSHLCDDFQVVFISDGSVYKIYKFSNQ